MKKAMISDLKNRLSHYLRFVRKGESVLVLDRDRPIARIDPIGADATDDDLAHLVRRGAVRPPSRQLPADWVAQAVRTDADLLGALLEERAEGR